MDQQKLKMFVRDIWKYYAQNKRNFPWRETKDPYAILVSEIMLQQTQTKRVLEKYKEFLKCFPTIQSLHKASLRKILNVWQGLGYNRRALALKKIGDIVFKKYKGKIPNNPSMLVALPGIGEATAGAICAFAFNIPTVFIETNIRRVYIHFFFKGPKKVNDEEIKKLLRATIDKKKPREWYYALMDFGSMLGHTQQNPNRKSAMYKVQSVFEGSDRQLRAKIIRFLLSHKTGNQENFSRIFSSKIDRIEKILTGLEKDGLIKNMGSHVKLS